MRIKVFIVAILSPFLISAAFGQGSLTPSGAPAPTMKSLDQIEARTPVDATHTPGDSGSLFNITQSGSYYLTTNIVGAGTKAGIVIYTNDVSIDLNGFSIIGSGSSTYGILVDASLFRTNVTIRNGTVRNWHSGGLELTPARNVQLRELHVLNNSGIAGIHTGGGALITDCSVSGNSVPGILVGSGSTVRNCIAYQNATNGIVTSDSCLILNCTATYNSSTGIVTDVQCVIKDCIADENTQGGILCSTASFVSGCEASHNSGDGIFIGSNCRVFQNNCAFNGGAGIHNSAGSSRSYIDGNTIILNSASGLNVNDSIIYRNVINNNTNFIGNFNDFGPTNAIPSTATSPWANF